MVLVLAACSDSNANGCWRGGEYKLYGVFPSQYFINIKGKSVTQSTFIEDPTGTGDHIFTLWEGEIKERTESERGLEILVKYNKVEQYRKDSVINVKNLAAEEQTAKYRIANDTISSLRMPIKFTRCRKGDMPTVNDYKAGKCSK